MPAFWDGGKRFVVRFSPDEPGEWTYRLSGNLPSLEDKEGKFSAIASDAPGFIKPANLHHWIYPDTIRPHLWMGDTCLECFEADRARFDAYAAKRAEQKFTHVRALLMGGAAFAKADTPQLAYFREVDERVAALHKRGIITDIILGKDDNQLARLFTNRELLRRYLQYAVARYGAFSVTWELAQEFEEYENPRGFFREMGLLLKELDPYNSPRSVHAKATSSAHVGDKWMNYLLYQSGDDALGAIEHQIYPGPQVNAGFGAQPTSAADEFVRLLWNSTMNGQYPASPGGMDLETPQSKAMTAWFELFSRTRHWELEPYFDLDGGRALALPDVEYVVYVEKPGSVEIRVEKHEYQVYWMDPATGVITKEKKDWKGEVFRAQTPDSTRPWVLHLSRDGRKEGMLKGYKFESRPNIPQDPDVNALKAPFELIAPKAGETLPTGVSIPFEIKLKRETLGTRRMMYLLTGDITRDAEGFRPLASGSKGTFTIPPVMLKQDQGVMNMRLHALNAAGKLYSIDIIFPVTKQAGSR
jgi:hypothetical protein